MRLDCCLIILTFFGIFVLAQEQEQPSEERTAEEQQADQPPANRQQTFAQQAEQQTANRQLTEEQQPSEQQQVGLKDCKPTGLRPGPNAILIAPELTIEFDAQSKEIRNVSFQAAPAWAPDSLSRCTVNAGRGVPPSGRKVSYILENSQFDDSNKYK